MAFSHTLAVFVLGESIPVTGIFCWVVFGEFGLVCVQVFFEELKASRF